MFRMRCRKKGFTLIEILVVLMLLGIITSVAIPRFTPEFQTKQRIKSEAQKIVSNIRYARKLAVTDIDAVLYIISFDYPGKNYGIYRDSAIPANLIGSLIPIPPEITASGETGISFYRQGNCTLEGSGMIDISAGSHNYLITVQTATGRALLREN